MKEKKIYYWSNPVKTTIEEKYYPDSSSSNRSYETFMEAKLALIEELTRGFIAVTNSHKKIHGAMLDELRQASEILKSDTIGVKTNPRMTKERFNEVFNKTLEETSELYEFYEECGAKWSGDFMLEAHSEALEWCAKEVFGCTEYLDKKAHLKMPKSLVSWSFKSFENNQLKDKDGKPIWGNFDFKKINEEYKIYLDTQADSCNH